jgi:hypothetical protein
VKGICKNSQTLSKNCIEEGEEVQAKRTHNIFNKLITENFLKKNYEHSGTGSLQETKQT